MKKKLHLWKRIAVGALSVLTILAAIPPMTVKADVDENTFTVTQGNTSTAFFKHTHKHNGSHVTDAKVQSNQTISGYSASGLCYTEVHQHSHEGDTTRGGACYEGHKHVAGTGAVYDPGNGKTYYKTAGGCYLKATRHNFMNTSGGSGVYYDTCPSCGGTMSCTDHSSTCAWCGNTGSSTTRRCGCGYIGDSAAPTCYHDCYELSCTLSESDYQLKSNCGFYTNPVYTLNCGISNGSVMARVDVRAENDNTLTYAVSRVDSHATVSRVWTVPAASKVNKNSDSFKCDVPGNYVCTVTVTVTGDNGQTVETDTATFTYTAVPQDTTVNLINDDDSVFRTYTMQCNSENGSVGIPTKTGYNFLGWYDAKTGGTQVYNASGARQVVGFCPLNGGEVKLYARYEAKAYNIRFTIVNSKLETATNINQTVYYDQTNVKLGQNAKQYDGYTFLGFYHGDVKYFDTDGSYLETSGTWNRTENLAVEAKYQANTYTLNYNLNKEDPVGTQNQSVTYDQDYSLTTEDLEQRASYKGYTFLGWIDDVLGTIFKADGTKDATQWKYTQDVNAKATYEANSYTVTYYVENPEEETAVTETETVVFDSEAKLNKAKKEYNGWTFEGWYDGTKKLFNTDGTYVNGTWDLEESVTVTPKFTPISYTLSYSLNKEEEVTAHTKTIPFNSAYGLSAEDIAARKAYKGYTFLGWFDGTTQIFDADGNNTDTGIWRTVGNVNAKATYEANHYHVYYNTNEADAPSKSMEVVFDQPYTLPEGDVSSVPVIDGYTFDGWFDAEGNKIFKVNGTPVATPYDYDSDITVYVRYHKNKYTVHYNNGTVDDSSLDKSIVVTFDESYIDIAQAPYKPGYVFDGHSIKGTNTFIWDGKGSKTHAIWDFVCGVDGTEIDAVKNYTPKTFTIHVGDDFDNDGVIDGAASDNSATYDSAWFDLSVPAHIDGYTFDGYYLVDKNVFIATYANGTLTKESATWVWDDNLNWNNDAHTGEYTLVRRWHKNAYKVHYNNTAVADTTLGQTMTVTYDTAYPAISQSPYKTGYVFKGHILDGTDTYVWGEKGAAIRDTWTYVIGEDNEEVNVKKVYDPKVLTLNIGEDYNEDKALDSVKETKTVTYDAAFTLNVPEEKTGLTFVGYYILGTDTCIASYNKSTKVLTYTSSTWIWDDGDDWVTTGATGATILVEQRYSRNEYTATIKTTTDALNDDGSYKVDTKTQKFTYDRDFSSITVPTKKGYDFGGYKVVGGTYDGEFVWDASGKKTKETWLWAENITLDAVWTAKTYTVEFAKGSFTITYDQEIAKVTADSKNGHTFKGYAFNSNLGGAKVFDSEGKPTTTLWRYDIGANGTKTTLESLFDINYYTVVVDYEGEFPEERLGTMYGTKSANITVPTKTGYVLEGFVAKGTVKFLYNELGVPVDDYYVNGDETVTPVWRAKKYIIRTNTGWATEITYGEKTPVFNGNAPTQEYSDFLGFFRGNGVVIRTDGTFVQNPWMTDLGPDGAVINLNAKFTDPVYPEEEEEVEDVIEEDSEEETEEETSEPTSEPASEPEVIEKEDEPVKGHQFLETLKTVAPYVGVTAGVIVFFGAAAALVLTILFGLGRIAKVYVVNNASMRKKFGQLVFVGNLSGYEKTGLTSLAIKLPRKYYDVLNSNINNTIIVVQLSKAFVIKNVGKKISIGCANLTAEYDVAENIEV